jgi:NAD-dependent dihydropyrimidine dehydrogenase PreA subunit
MPSSSECKEPGRLVPVVDRSRCEGKRDCVEVCPYHVFDVRKLTDAERGRLGLLTRIKVFVHGGRQAFATRAQDCHACGRCVSACPEKAIKLRAAG